MEKKFIRTLTAAITIAVLAIFSNGYAVTKNLAPGSTW
jgi:hypothetical protein